MTDTDLPIFCVLQVDHCGPETRIALIDKKHGCILDYVALSTVFVMRDDFNFSGWVRNYKEALLDAGVFETINQEGV